MPLTHSVGASYIFSLVIFHLLHLTCSLSLLASHMSLLVSRLSLLTCCLSLLTCSISLVASHLLLVICCLHTVIKMKVE